MIEPVEFTVTAAFNGRSVEVERFDRFVQREIQITEAQAKRVTTGLADGRHVPTEVFKSGGKWYARINSLTNSVYTLISCEKTFTDAAGTWYSGVADEMASRQIMNGRDNGAFDGGAYITRAEFAAIVVRALGLPANGVCYFTDVAKDAWYYGSVGTAVEYGLVSGRDAYTFDPDARITRQEAMQLIFNASEIAPVKLLSGINPGQYSDVGKVADWAADAAGFNLLNGLVKGDGGLIRPLDNITRAESATIVLRLLQKAELVDVRTAV